MATRADSSAWSGSLRCYPSNALIKAFFSPAGTGGEDQPLHHDTFVMDSFNFLTPIDETTTRYFWFQMRNVAPNDAGARSD